MSEIASRPLQVETIDGVTVAGFADSELLAEDAIERAAAQLDFLLDALGPGRLLLSFREVRYMSSAMLGVLVKCARRVKGNGGRLKLCCLSPTLMEIFRIGSFDRLFEIHQGEAEALDSSWDLPAPAAPGRV